MSNENNNNDDEEMKTKTTLSRKEQESNKNTNNANSTEKNKKILRRRFSNLYNGRASLLIEDPTESNNFEKMKKDLKRGLTKRVPNPKKKKGKKAKKKEQEPVLLTEVKQLVPKIEEKKESVTHKFLREKLEKLNFSKNLQTGINSGFDKINLDIKDDLVDKINIKDKKINLETIINNKRKIPELNLGKNGITYNLNKQSILRLKHLKADEKYIKKRLNKIEESEKLIKSEEPIKNDVIALNIRNNNLKKYSSMKNELLFKLKYNSSIISDVLDKDKVLNRNLLMQNYNNHTNNIELDNFSKQFSLSEDQEKFNKYLIKKQQEEQLKREQFQNELKKSNKKKLKKLN